MVKTQKFDTEKMYLIGAYCWNLAGLLTTDNVLKDIRKLAELKDELKRLGLTAGTLSLDAVKIQRSTAKYVEMIASGGGGVIAPADKEALSQFAQSGKYIERIAKVLFETPASKHEQLDKDVVQAVLKAQGKANFDSDFLEWARENDERAFNKFIQLKNKY